MLTLFYIVCFCGVLLSIGIYIYFEVMEKNKKIIPIASFTIFSLLFMVGIVQNHFSIEEQYQKVIVQKDKDFEAQQNKIPELTTSEKAKNAVELNLINTQSWDHSSIDPFSGVNFKVALNVLNKVILRAGMAQNTQNVVNIKQNAYVNIGKLYQVDGEYISTKIIENGDPILKGFQINSRMVAMYFDTKSTNLGKPDVVVFQPFIKERDYSYGVGFSGIFIGITKVDGEEVLVFMTR